MYTEQPDEYGHLFTIEEFRNAVRQGYLIDYDGYGYAMKDGLVDDSQHIYPSQTSQIPQDATHIIWYNR